MKYFTAYKWHTYCIFNHQSHKEGQDVVHVCHHEFFFSPTRSREVKDSLDATRACVCEEPCPGGEALCTVLGGIYIKNSPNADYVRAAVAQLTSFNLQLDSLNFSQCCEEQQQTDRPTHPYLTQETSASISRSIWYLWFVLNSSDFKSILRKRSVNVLSSRNTSARVFLSFAMDLAKLNDGCWQKKTKTKTWQPALLQVIAHDFFLFYYCVMLHLLLFCLVLIGIDYVRWMMFRYNWRPLCLIRFCSFVRLYHGINGILGQKKKNIIQGDVNKVG